MEPLRIGIVGVGNISGIYLQNLKAYKSTEIVAIADLDSARAKSVADANGIGKVVSTDELVKLPEVELVLNLTIPKAHAAVAQASVEAGKHVYNEKPLTVDREDGRKLLATAKANNVRVGCAPDTFLGAGIQTCRKLIDDGAIGEIVAANAFMLCRGHETWHPSPEFYYEVGGGPMLDMGPYYVTALVALIGGINRVSGSARVTFPTRTITSAPKNGKVIEVETPTHIVGVLDFANGAVGQITTSFDVYGNSMQPIVIYGSEGTLLVPDPNGFGGEVKLSRKGGEFETIPLTHGFAENSRGLGVLDIAYAARNGGEHRASGDLAFHVLDVMHAINESSASEKHIHIASAVERPAAMAVDQFADEA